VVDGDNYLWLDMFDKLTEGLDPAESRTIANNTSQPSLSHINIKIINKIYLNSLVVEDVV
jgi:hypothetical protein